MLVKSGIIVELAFPTN